MGSNAAIATINFDARQLQRKYKHAKDFGVQGNFNPANAQKFEQALTEHVGSSSARIISGTYHGQPVTHYVDPKTGLNVMKDSNGQFVSGWKLNPAQLQNVIARGRL